MKMAVSVFLISVSLIFSNPGFAKEDKKQGKVLVTKKEKGKKKEMEVVTKTGIIEVRKAANEKEKDQVYFKVGTEKFKLIMAQPKFWDEVKALAGKEVTVKGPLLPVDEKHPEVAIKLKRFQEGKTIEGKKKGQGNAFEKVGALKVGVPPIFLVVDGKEIKINPGKIGQEGVKKLSELDGKKVKIKGSLLPPNEKRKVEVIRLESFEEAK